MNIAIDMMGGDYAPLEVALGIAQYFKQPDTKAQLMLLGIEQEIAPLIESYQFPKDRIQIIHCPDTIGYDEHPVRALKEKQQSSIATGFGLLVKNKADVFISAGNTGAMLVGSILSLKPLEGVLRPTIATIIPRINDKTGLLLDVGINSDCKPEHLNQFATMGAAYANIILGINNPSVGLLNIGEEEGKGNLLSQAAYPLLKANKAIRFVGNIEGRDILEDKADVMVCDGFTGNILLKLLESVYSITRRQGIEHEYFDRFHFEQYGGTPVLGVGKPVIIGHGVSGHEAFMNMIVVAEKIVETDFLNRMKDALLTNDSIAPLVS